MTKYNGRTWELFPAEGKYWYAGPKYKAISPAPGSYLEEDARLISAAPALLYSLQEMRDACAACFRVVSRHPLVDEMKAEFDRIGIQDGFGVRADQAIAKTEGSEQP